MSAPRPFVPTGQSHTWVDPQLEPVLVGVIALAVVATSLLFVLGVGAYARRRSTRYLLITIAIGLLLARSIVGLGTVLGLVPMTVHHLVEHGFDVLIASLVLYAVYRAGPVSYRSERTDDE